MLGNREQKAYLSDMIRQPIQENQKISKKKLYITFDGGSRGNPGISGSGAFIGELETDGLKNKMKVLNMISIFIGEKDTNNKAEYLGLIYALLSIKQQEQEKELIIIGDSKMILSLLENVKITGANLFFIAKKTESTLYSSLQKQE